MAPAPAGGPAPAALTLARQTALAPEAPDAAALRQHQRACLHRAGQLAYQLAQLPERAAEAQRRRLALPTLRAALVLAGTAPPAWLAAWEAAARAELARSGSRPRPGCTCAAPACWPKPPTLKMCSSG